MQPRLCSKMDEADMAEPEQVVEIPFSNATQAKLQNINTLKVYFTMTLVN